MKICRFSRTVATFEPVEVSASHFRSKGSRNRARNALAIEIEFRGRYSELANLVFSGKLPSMEAEIDCKLQSNSR